MSEIAEFVRDARDNVSDLRNFSTAGHKTLNALLNTLERALDLLEPPATVLPSEHFKITPAFKLSLDHGGEYHEEYFDTEAAALAAASRAASELPQVPAPMKELRPSVDWEKVGKAMDEKRTNLTSEDFHKLYLPADYHSYVDFTPCRFV